MSKGLQVKIYGQNHTMARDLDVGYVPELAHYVDVKMSLLSATTQTVDSVRALERRCFYLAVSHCFSAGVYSLRPPEASHRLDLFLVLSMIGPLNAKEGSWQSRDSFPEPVGLYSWL